MIKPRLYRPDSDEKKVTVQRIASFLMKGSMELLHIFVPFISEEIWQYFKSENENSICISDLPEYNPNLNNPAAEKQIEFLQEAIGALRAEMNIEPGLGMELVLAENDKQFKFINDNAIHFTSLAKIKNISAITETFNRDNAAATVIQGTELFIPLEGLIDKEKERNRLEREMNRLQNLEQGILKKLENKNFIEKAPDNIVKGERNKLADIRLNLEKVKDNFQKYFG